jgi:crossover junction endodeoxyribonuclease RuvC
MIILGIDTALRCTGYGLIKVSGKSYRAIDCGVIKTKQKEAHSECLRRLAGGIQELVDTYSPDIASIEGIFYMKNVKTAMVLGMARGSVIAVLAKHNIPTFEYAPKRAKQAITGHGAATKAQVATVLSGMLKLDVNDIPDDSTDALSLAICHHITATSIQGTLKDPL